MSWIADVVAGTKILSAWGNAIRDRTVTPFVNKTERDGAITAPKFGMTTVREDSKGLEYYDGAKYQGIPRGSVARKYLSGRAGFNGLWYDVSQGGIFLTVPAGRCIEVVVQGTFYFVGNCNINMRVERPAGNVLAQAADRFHNGGGANYKDIATLTAIVYDHPPAGVAHYVVAATTQGGQPTDIPLLDPAWANIFSLNDVGPDLSQQ
jgi:hypothetical protein